MFSNCIRSVVKSATYLLTLLLTFFSPLLADSNSLEITIGVSLPLSGEAATYGTDILNTLKFANSKIADNRFRFVVEDDRCTGKDAVTIAQRFAHVERLRYVLGFACSGALLAAAPVYERAKVTVIAAATSSADISKTGRHILRTCHSDAYTASLLFQHVNRRYERFAVLSEETEFCQSLLASFEENNAHSALIAGVVAHSVALMFAG